VIRANEPDLCTVPELSLPEVWTACAAATATTGMQCATASS